MNSISSRKMKRELTWTIPRGLTRAGVSLYDKFQWERTKSINAPVRHSFRVGGAKTFRLRLHFNGCDQALSYRSAQGLTSSQRFVSHDLRRSYHKRASQGLQNAALVPAQVFSLSDLDTALIHHLHRKELSGRSALAS